jgi:hypothetical protein
VVKTFSAEGRYRLLNARGSDRSRDRQGAVAFSRAQCAGNLDLLCEKLVATNPNVEPKGAAVPYTSLNGHLFSDLSNEGKLALRLPVAEREAFLKNYMEVVPQYVGSLKPTESQKKD